MESPHLQRAQMLLAHHRFEQASEQLMLRLSEEPNDSFAHALLALCWKEMPDRLADATREAEMAVHLAPDQPLPHYVLATVYLQRKRFDEAQQAISAAIQLNPTDSDYYALQSHLHIQKEQWKQALNAAESGLQFDPESQSCLALRTFSLERLGLAVDAIEQADEAIASDPDSSTAHASRGWALLQSGRYREAEVSFREALRLEPNNEFAREGVRSSLKNHHFLYRAIFKFYTFTGRMQSGQRWAVLIGLYILVQLLNRLGDRFPNVNPFVRPLIFLYIGFAVLSWNADLLFNFALRFHKSGKYLLNAKEKLGANLIGTILFAALVVGTLGTVYDSAEQGFLLGLCVIVITLPVSTIFQVDQGWPQWVAIGASMWFLMLCCLGLLLALLNNDAYALPLLLELVSCLVYGFAANWLRSVTVQQ